MSGDPVDGSQPWSTALLGLPAAARVLIINADDLGMYPEINGAVLDAVEQGVASSCSVMPPGAGASDALRMLAARPHVPFGIHLTLVSDGPGQDWAPVTAASEVPSLVDRRGHLLPALARAEFLRRARLDEVEVEVRAQIQAVLAAGLEPTHLDWHCLADGGRPDISELGLALAVEYGWALRVWLEPGRRVARGRGLPVVDHRFVDTFALDPETKAQELRLRLQNLPPGLSEWAVHPGVDTPAARAVDRGWRVRSSDLEFLLAPQTRDLVEREDISVVDYRPLRDVWRRGGP